MQENKGENIGDQNPTQTPPLIDENPHDAEGGKSFKNGFTKVIKWLKRNHKVAQLIVSTILMIFTGLLYLIAAYQSESSKKAADAAIKSNLLTETVFKNTHKSILAHSGIMKVDTTNHTFKISYDILNITAQPILITGITQGFYFDTIQFRKQPKDIINKISQTISLYRTGTPSGYAVYTTDPIEMKFSDKDMYNFKNGIDMLFSELRYINLTTNDPCVYQVITRASFAHGGLLIETPWNKNTVDSAVMEK